jgi:hypothetical protein
MVPGTPAPFCTAILFSELRNRAIDSALGALLAAS